MSDLKCIITREGHLLRSGVAGERERVIGQRLIIYRRPVAHTSAMRALCEWTREILYAAHFSFLTLAGDATRSQLQLSHS